MAVSLKDRRQLTEEWIRRLLTYSSEVTWFGANSVMRAWALAIGTLVEFAVLLYVQLLRRFLVQSSSGDALKDAAAERGADQLPGSRAKLFVVVSPFSATVLSIANAATSLIEVDDSSGFLATDSIRIRNQDGIITEIRTIIAITTGTGPNGGDELEVALLTGTYNPSTEDVAVILRATIVTGTVITTSAGINFQTLAPVTTGEANPVLRGESGALALADKVWCEAVTIGEVGNVDALSVIDFLPTIRGVTPFNPEPGTGGSDVETDLDLKYRAIHLAVLANQETIAWLEALTKQSNGDMLRAVPVLSSSAGVMGAGVLKRNGGTFTSAELLAMETYANARVRSYMTVDLDNITLTSVQVSAQITLDPDATLEAVYRTAADRLAQYLDFRKWQFGAPVDEAALLSIVRQTPGVASLVTSTFLPAADVEVGDQSLPTLSSLSLQDLTTGNTINASLSETF